MVRHPYRLKHSCLICLCHTCKLPRSARSSQSSHLNVVHQDLVSLYSILYFSSSMLLGKVHGWEYRRKRRRYTVRFSVHLYRLMFLCSYIISSDWGRYPDSQDLRVSHACHWLQHQLYTQGQGPYAVKLKKTEGDIKEVQKCVDEKLGVKESDTGLAAPNPWDLVSDRERMTEQP